MCAVAECTACSTDSGIPLSLPHTQLFSINKCASDQCFCCGLTKGRHVTKINVSTAFCVTLNIIPILHYRIKLFFEEYFTDLFVEILKLHIFLIQRNSVLKRVTLHYFMLFIYCIIDVFRLTSVYASCLIFLALLAILRRINYEVFFPLYRLSRSKSEKLCGL